MLRVLGVHGIGTHRYHRRAGSADGAAAALGRDWFRHLGTAMPPDSSVDLRMAYYAHHLKPESGHGVDDDPVALAPAEQRLLADWVTLLDPALAETAYPQSVAEAGDWLARAFGPAARLFALTFCRELNAYLEPGARAAARREVAATIAEHQPDVVLAHSLGSVVAYESLWEHQDCQVGLFVTVGSPLAMPGVVLDRLEPARERRKPPGVRRWVNVADVADIVALPDWGLGARFDGVERDLPVLGGMWEFQTPGAYLRGAEVSEVVFERRALA